MRKKVLVVLIIAALAITMTACGSSSSSTKTQPKKVTYSSILKDYTEKMKCQTPKLVKEYNTKAKKHTGDINALADICTKETEKLADTCTEGTQKMADLMTKNGDKQSVYEKWAKKLQNVYQNDAKKITDAYTKSRPDTSEIKEPPRFALQTALRKESEPLSQRCTGINHIGAKMYRFFLYTKKEATMAGTKQKRQGDAWMLQVQIDGKRFNKTVHCKSEAGADRELAKFYSACESGAVNTGNIHSEIYVTST